MAMENLILMDIVTLLVQAACIISSMAFLYFSVKSKLTKIPNLYLTYILVISDMVHAVSVFPYTLYLTFNWSSVYFSLDPLIVLLTAIPLPFQLKVNLVILIGIALDRVLAIFYPALYRKKNHKLYSLCTVILAVFLGVLDNVLAVVTAPFTPRPNCSTFGCFVSKTFKYYWGGSNSAMGIVVIVLVTLIFVKFKKLAQSPLGGTEKERKRFARANKCGMCTLICSLFCITIPGAAASVSEVLSSTSLSMLTNGPFYVLGLVSAGFCHSITQLYMNKEILLRKKTVLISTTPTAAYRADATR